MMRLCKKTAQYSNGVLTLNVSNSKVPGVVRLDLSSISLAHFCVRSTDEGSVLGYNDASARFTALALFADRADADKALAAIEYKMVQPTWLQRLLKMAFLLLAVVTTIILINWLWGTITGLQSRMVARAPQTIQQAAPQAPAARPGLPVDADSQFNN